MSQAAQHPIILSPSYFPPVPWVALIMTHQSPILDVHSWFQKQRLSSRTWIKGPEGPICLTIPVEKRSTRAPLIDKKVSYQENWTETHFRSLKNYYKNSPYFEICEEEIRDFFEKRPVYLLDWIEGSMNLINQLLGESYNWSKSTKFLNSPAGAKDYREDFGAGGRQTEYSWYKPLQYQQVFEPFNGGLSFLDLLFSKGRESILIAKSGILNAEKGEP